MATVKESCFDAKRGLTIECVVEYLERGSALGKALREAQAEVMLEVLQWVARREGFGDGLCVPDDGRGS